MGRRKVSSRTRNIGGMVRPEIADRLWKHAKIVGKNQGEILDHAITLYLGSQDAKREHLERRLKDLETKLAILEMRLKPEAPAVGRA